MKRITALLLSISIILFIYGCATSKKKFTEEKRVREKIFNSRFDYTFMATLSALENKGYKIDEIDKEKGLIFTLLSPEPFLSRLINPTRDAFSAKIIPIDLNSSKVILMYYKERKVPYAGWVDDDRLSVQDYDNKVNEMYRAIEQHLNSK